MSDGMVGMYDSVTDKFHVSPNGNKFTAGPAVLSKLRLGCGDSGYAYDFSTSTLDVDAGIPVSFMESGSLAGDCDMRKFQDLEIEERASSRTPVVSWPSKPSDIDTVRFMCAPGENRRAFVAKDDGLYAMTGFVLIVK